MHMGDDTATERHRVVPYAAVHCHAGFVRMKQSDKSEFFFNKSEDMTCNFPAYVVT